MTSLQSLDLFSGIGGFSLALQGFAKTVAFCDNSSSAQNVLRARMADGRLDVAPIIDDVRTIGSASLPHIDIITAGFPCQDVSTVGINDASRSGTSGLVKERSGLVLQVMRLTNELKPSLVLLENVKAITRDPAFEAMLRGFAKIGYRGYWDQFNAASMGFPHQRNRWFMLAVRDDGKARHLCRRMNRIVQHHGDATLHKPRKELPLMEHPRRGSEPIRTRLELLGNSLIPDVARNAFSSLLVRSLEAQTIADNAPLTAGSFSSTGIISTCPANSLARVSKKIRKPLQFLPDADATNWRSGGGRNSVRDKLVDGAEKAQWSTPRHGVRLGVKSLTARTQNDLPVQLIYWDGTPERLRQKALASPFEASASPRFVEDMMGYSRDWTALSKFKPLN
jgi:DNA-cytosine methyltransferase